MKVRHKVGDVVDLRAATINAVLLGDGVPENTLAKAQLNVEKLIQAVKHLPEAGTDLVALQKSSTQHISLKTVFWWVSLTHWPTWTWTWKNTVSSGVNGTESKILQSHAS